MKVLGEMPKNGGVTSNVTPSCLQIFKFFAILLLNRGKLDLIIYVCYQKTSEHEVFQAIK